jgi:hypothetical protein
MAQWKQLERDVAKFFGGQRHVRMNWAEHAGDIDGLPFIVEVKYGNQVPASLNVKEPTLLDAGDKQYIAAPSTNVVPFGICLLLSVDDETAPLPVKKCRSKKFIEDALSQAKGYGDAPCVLAVKPRGRKGFVLVWQA